MSYGDLQFIDIIIFAAIAGFLIYRLRNVLGKRSGFQKQKKHTKNINLNPANKKTAKTEIPQLKESETKLSKVYEFYPDFDHKNFLEGAKYAFESIINAYNKNDKQTLKKLLTKEVYNSFEESIDKKNNDSSFQFYSLVVNAVENVTVESNIVSITLLITSEQFKDNDENTITKKQDIWTFQKNMKSDSPIWLLSST